MHQTPIQTIPAFDFQILPMSLPHAILGLLQQQQQTGYDLKTECFDRCLAHLWPADQAQIYRTLDKLQTQGWIDCTVEIQRDRPNRKVYCITAAGTAELTRWLQTHQPLPVVREPLLVQLYFAAQLPDAAILQLLNAGLAAHQEKLATCQQVEVPPLDEPSATREQRLQRLVLNLVCRREQVYLGWLEEAIALFRTTALGEGGDR